MDGNPTLPDLTPDDRIWRLDWFGELAYPPSIRRYAQPSVKVSLSPLLCDPGDHEALLRPDSTDHHHSHQAWVPVAALPLLAIGDLWQGGQQVTSPGYQTERFKGLDIREDNTSFVKAGLAIDEHFLLPLSRHPWHLQHTQSYCVTVAVPDNVRLIIPCMEIIRFYFGSSGNLLQRLVTGPLAAERFWASKRYDAATGHLHLTLASRLSGASATDIGRIAASRLAWRSAAGIFASCQKATAQGEPAYPYTGFPFEGRTNLVASGLWLPFSDREHATFLVYRLRSCSHPFPFRSLSYEAADRKAWHDRHQGNTSGPGRYSASSSKRKRRRTVDADPGANKAQRTKAFKTDRRFPDLARKPVWREKIEAMPAADVFLRHDDGTLEQVAFGEAEGTSDVAGVDATQVAERKEGVLPWFVRAGMKAITENPKYRPPGASIKLISLAGKSDPVFSMPLIIDQNGEISCDLLFTAPNGSTRPRRACFVEVSAPASPPKYALIVEARASRNNPEISIAVRPEVVEAIEFLAANCTRQKPSRLHT